MNLLQKLLNQRKEQRKKHLLEAAHIVSDILLELKDLTKPGVSLAMLDELVARRIKERGATSYNFKYHPTWAKFPYPAYACYSVDEEICHTPPGMRELQEGQIITYDLGVKYRGSCGDAALTVAVGEVSSRKQRLMRYAERALMAGISVVKAGVPVSAIGKAVQKEAEANGYNVIRDFGGHGIGSMMHEKPMIPNFYDPKFESILLEEGQTLCIEPMLTTGKANVGILGTDGWTAFVTDGQPVAMFESMILVGKEKGEVLTYHLAMG